MVIRTIPVCPDLRDKPVSQEAEADRICRVELGPAQLCPHACTAAAPDVDAIFVASDLMAMAVLQVLAASGRRVPDDVAVVGFDDSPPARMTTPTLTTIHQPVKDLAALAVRALTDRPSRPLDRRLPTHLVIRASAAA